VSEQSIVFDRAAEYYDETRSLPPEVQRALIDQAIGELSGRGACLEIGVGTGRYALPLNAAGIEMAGVDLSPKMLNRLVANAGGRSPVRLCLADATRLPFRDHSFGAGLGVHVLHLITDWREAVTELVRVVRPGGVLLFDVGGVWRGQQELDEFMTQVLGRKLRVGLTDAKQLDDFLNGLGVAVRELPAVSHMEERPPRLFIESILENKFSFTWALEDHERAQLAEAVKGWVEERFESLDEPTRREAKITWRAYDLAT
jgi:SAM-dependent methyltransferase